MAPPLALLLLLLVHGTTAGLEGKLTHVKKYEMVMPREVSAPRGKRDLAAPPRIYPDRVLYSIRAEGRDYLLQLEKNKELLGQHYTETHYLANGTEVTEKPDVRDHCFYQGHVRGYADSAASISTCGGLSGFFRVNETTFLLEPLEEDAASWHAVYRAAHLRGKRGTCREPGATLEYDHEPKIPAAMKLYRWKTAPLHKGPRYVELVLVVDNEEFRKHKDLRTVQNRMKEIVNHVDKLYQPLRLRVALIGLEVWSHKDKIVVSPNPEVTLDNFLHWREAELLRRKPHDNAQLITGIDFHGTTVGLAKKLVMCTKDSGGVNQDHSTNPIGAASTMAHEMGHNLGMSHDEDVAGCRCPVSKADGGCVMAASVGLVYPKLFSRCSEQDMWQFLGDPRTSCLLNVPRADELYGGPVCGNQFVERGEQCDCGMPEECSDRCCNATTCQLREGAECARGDCCQDCKVKAAGTLCRANKNDCDLPEHCTGLSAECPEDVFQENGIPCQNGNGYCYNGACPSHSEQCRALWGAEAQVAPDVCFKHNSEQHLHLHCLTEYGKRPCSPKDVKCGTLLCLSDNASPVLGGGSYSLFFGRFKCKAVIAGNDANEVVAKLRLVPTGAKCGEEMVCYAGRCQNLLVYGNKNCSAKCNNHGVCNHKRECHCDPGWAAPYCEQKISGMVAGSSGVVLVAVLAVLVLSSILLGSGVVLLRGKGMRRFQKGRTPGRPAAGLANPLFQEGGRMRPPRRQLSRHDIGHPSLLSSTAAPRDARPPGPRRPAPQVTSPASPGRTPQVTTPPKATAAACPVSPGLTTHSIQATDDWRRRGGGRNGDTPPPLPLLPVPLRVPPWCPGEGLLGSLLSSFQAKPKPPSKPLPALKSKVPRRAEGPPALPRSPPTPPSAFQRGVPLKVAPKPPPARR
ncbi:disintegrin and metalloproteinase domain-containing protein 8 isoform X2 [Tyto alba]|uniref:disintegrin and metalloproteinase domain-containing protein 8 isoform X2 n=1 Tax=Tyto alba TaxID=56313 RepID=UPI001C670DF3|nr:disintegrin and metalloproteinase domain-containing protein 8 isoform X2 [Tyto alba]